MMDYCEVLIKEEPVENEDFENFHSETMNKTEKEQTENEVLMNFENFSFKHFMEPEDTHVSETYYNEQQHKSVNFPRTSNSNFNQEHGQFILENNSEESPQDCVFVPDIKYQGILKCSLCQGTYFLNIQNLIEHGLDFHNVCFKCDRVSTEDHKACCETIDNFNNLLNCDQNNAKTGIIYECPTCFSVKFASVLNLQNHLISVHGLKACPQCNAILDSGHTLRKHTIEHNHQIPPKQPFEKKLISQPPHFGNTELQKHECNMCPAVFPNSLKLKHHLSSTHDFKLCAFPKCEKLFVTSEELRKHSVTHLTALYHQNFKNESFKCPLCLKHFKTQIFLEQHIQKNHVKCKICQNYFTSVPHLHQHYSNDHPEVSNDFTRKHIIALNKKSSHNGWKPMQYYCDICSKLFNQSKTRHNKIHFTKTRKYKCTECVDLIPFKKYALLKQHKEKCHPKYICDFCNKTFSESKEKFEGHIRKHVQNQCVKCPFIAINTLALKSHELNHHEQFNCDKCLFTCFGLLNIISHTDEMDHKFKCILCKFSTFKEKDFRKHVGLRSHLRVKSLIACDICLFQCRSKFEMEQHIIETHFGIS